MKRAKVASHELLVNQQRVTLLELLDRLLDKGVVAKGEIILSVADIDLVYLNLGLLLSSVKTVEKARGIGESSPSFFTGESEVANKDFFKEENPNIQWVESPVANKAVKTPRTVSAESADSSEVEELVKPENPNGESKKSLTKRNGELTNLPAGKAGIIPQTNIDPNNVEKGLTKLVLTLIELLRRLMEKQAIRRMEAGFLTTSETERMGMVFQRLEKRMGSLKQTFHLKDEDLNLDLGPLGELM